MSAVCSNRRTRLHHASHAPWPVEAHTTPLPLVQVARTFSVENSVGAVGAQLEVIAELRLPHTVLVRADVYYASNKLGTLSLLRPIPRACQ